MRRFAALAAAWLALFTGQAGAQPVPDAQEHEVKAAFLYKFPAFIEWPSRPAPEVPFVIAVIGAPAVAETLRGLAKGRQHNGRPIEIREVPDAQAVNGAHVVFLGAAAATRLPGLVRALAGAPTLIVSESAGALEQGSMINFVISDTRVRFDVAIDNADACGLRISSRLLAVARNVRGGRP